MPTLSIEPSARSGVSSGTSPQPMRICIVAHNAFGALANNGRGHIGGVEHQTSLLAKWLAAAGHAVSLVTWDDGSDSRAEIDGVRVLRVCQPRAGLPGLRFLHPRWTGLIKALRAADADVYYHNGAEYVTGQVALWCRRNGRGFVFSAAADADVDGTLPALTRSLDRRLYRTGLRLADAIIVQSEKQRSLLKKGFGRESSILAMPCPEEPDTIFTQRSQPSSHPRVLWVGRISPVKRLEWLLDMAEQTPAVHFDVVGPAEHSTYAAPLLERAKTIPNVTLHGRKNRRELVPIYQSADCLCCTSIREGFPNTFLEAWSHGVPVVSTLDVDSRISTLGLGAIATSPKALSEAIVHLFADHERWRTASRTARQYFIEQHSLATAMPRFASCFKRVASNR